MDNDCIFLLRNKHFWLVSLSISAFITSQQAHSQFDADEEQLVPSRYCAIEVGGTFGTHLECSRMEINIQVHVPTRSCTFCFSTEKSPVLFFLYNSNNTLAMMYSCFCTNECTCITEDHLRALGFDMQFEFFPLPMKLVM